MKHYNPFKMFGSWIGAGYSIVIGFLFIFSHQIYFMYALAPFFPMIFIFNLLGCTGAFECQGNGLGLIIGLLLIPIYGFLVGYGIHSLVRRLR